MNRFYCRKRRQAVYVAVCIARQDIVADTAYISKRGVHERNHFTICFDCQQGRDVLSGDVVLLKEKEKPLPKKKRCRCGVWFSPKKGQTKRAFSLQVYCHEHTAMHSYWRDKDFERIEAERSGDRVAV